MSQCFVIAYLVKTWTVHEQTFEPGVAMEPLSEPMLLLLCR